MSKELEAFKKIVQEANKCGMWHCAIEINIVEEALTPPTADEVCEAIQSELDYGTVEYVEGNREFMFVNHGEKANITDVYGDRYKVTGFYKSSTLALIGRFYEGLK